MDSVNAIVKKVIYYNEENGFIIISAKSDSFDSEITIKGKSVQLESDLPIFCEGKWIDDTKFGLQFMAESIKPDELDDAVKILKYLESGAIKGIGKKTAKLIVDKFGSETLRILDHDINKLKSVPRIGEKTLEKIKNSWLDKRSSQYIITELLAYNLTYSMALKIFSTYKMEASIVIKENAYQIINEIKGFTFEMADKIALSLGKEKDDPERILNGLIYVIKRDEARLGNTCIDESKLLLESSSLLSLGNKKIQEIIEHSTSLIKETEVNSVKYYQFLENNKYEKSIAKNLNKILNNKTDNSIDKEIRDEYFEKGEFPYSEQQISVVNNVLSHKMSIITGGPGVGKTTVLKAIIEQILIKYKRKDILNLASPTGKAAQRMAEATGNVAKTIHRLLEFDMEFGGFRKNESDKIAAKFIIIDESSMIDLWLFYSLVSAIDHNSTLVIIGDVDQLSSVGSGAILRDLINSNKILVNELNVIKRQGAGSAIIENAHNVNNGDFFSPNKPDSDFYFINTKNDQQTLDKIIEMVNVNIPKKFGFKTEDSIQLLTPMHKGILGTQNLNHVFQKIFNKNSLLSSNKIVFGDNVFFEGDKIIQTRNNYEKMIFNGDAGKIISISGKYIIIDFDGEEVELAKNDLVDISHFYGGTIHKSQGSEYEVVIIPITNMYNQLLDRTLLYTGITRGKKLVIVVGSSQNVWRMINNKNSKKRNTLLKEKLLEFII
jgi:exodeoxyribonuclease V alpha subunit